MNLWRLLLAAILVSVGCIFSIVGCAYDEPKVVHHVVPPENGHRLGCRLCYNEMVRVVRGPPKHRRYKMVERHRCAECMTDVAFYVSDDGTLMIRCARCAPEGAPCDRCLPPAPPTTQPSGSRLSIEVLGFEGCPNTPKTRLNVERAVAALRLRADIAYVDQEKLPVGDLSRRWPTPTVLVNGRDLFGMPLPKDDAASCRMYPGGAPSVEELTYALQAFARR